MTSNDVNNNILKEGKRDNSKIHYPKLYTKDYAKILEEIKNLASSYLGKKWMPSFQYDLYAKLNEDYLVNSSNNELDFKGYDDVGLVSSRIFADIYLEIIIRLNKVPERNFIAFLNMLGFILSTSVAAKVPVKFNLVKGTPEDILVLAGTKVAAAKTEIHDELVFETQENVSITRANISSILSVIKDKDIIYDHSIYLTNQEKFELFTDKKNGSLQEHILYLGNKNVFNIEPIDTKIYIKFLGTESKKHYNSLIDFFGNPNLVQWEYNWKIDKDTRKETKGSALKFNVSIESIDDNRVIVLSYDSQNILLEDKKQIEKIMINNDKEAENYWIRCRLLKQNVNSLAKFFETVPTINNIIAWTEVKNFMIESVVTNDHSDREIQKINSVVPDFLFYNDVPLEIPQISEHGITREGEEDEEVKIYPFGKIPLTFDTFYIGSKSIFSKKHANIFLVFETKIDSNDTYNTNNTNNTDNTNFNLFDHPDVILSWEYWNGNNWNNLKVKDCSKEEQCTNDELKKTILCFECPDDIESTIINGVESFWISVRISSGDYGRGTLIQDEPGLIKPIPDTDVDKSTMEWISGTFKWEYKDVKEPHFKTLSLSAQYDNLLCSISNDQEVEKPVLKKRIRDLTLDAITYNNLEYIKYLKSNIDDAIIENNQTIVFKPFLIFMDNKNDIDNNKFPSTNEEKKEGPSLYIGFDYKIEKSPTIIYFLITENLFYEHIESALELYYFSGVSKNWKRLDNIDETRYLQKKGYLKLFLPADFDSFTLFGRKLYWIKIVDGQGLFHGFDNETNFGKIKFPLLQGIYLNTVECLNASKVVNEILTRKLDTQFLFSKKPLSSTIEEKESQEKIWIREDMGLNYNKENRNSNSDNVDNLRFVRDSNDEIIESWILWEERSDLGFSRPNDRHYAIDRKEGVVFFGNGINGKAVPMENNIVIANYTVGGGKEGNIDFGEIKTLKSLVPFIDSVINPEKGEGGSNMQIAQSGKEQWPNLIENRGQAVTIDDFENIIKNKFVSLSRVKCFSTTNNKGGFSPGEVLMIVVPESFDKLGNLIERPYPSIELLDNIHDYLSSRSSNIIISNNMLNITGPIYFKVTVSAEIFVKKLNDIVTVEKRALELIKNFLHPIKGGFDGNGWEFGKLLCTSDLYRLFSMIKDVEYVTNISFKIQFDEDGFYQNISLGVDEDIVEDKFKEVFTTPITDSNDSNSNNDSKLPPSSLLYSSNNHNLQVKYDDNIVFGEQI